MIVVVAAITTTLLLTGGVAADEGPHGGFTATTGNCQACHSPHRGDSLYILRGGAGTVYGFCMTCHGTGGDARTDVQAGQWTTGSAVWNTPDAYGDTNRQLNGGRLAGATSAHSVSSEQPGLTIWGADNSTGEDVTINYAFRCTTCHDPHGKQLTEVGGSGTQANGRTDNYRLLKNAPVKSWESEEDFGPGVVKSYTRAAWVSGGTASGSSGMNGFCGSCHADYVAETPASADSPNRPSGAMWAHSVNMNVTVDFSHHLNASAYKLPVDQISYDPDTGKYYSVDLTSPTAGDAAVLARADGTAGSYNGSTDKVACTTCHNAHGSLATDANSAFNLAGDPSLLRFDSRAVCQSCHRKGQ